MWGKNLANSPQRWNCCGERNGGTPEMMGEGQGPTPHGETEGTCSVTKSENIDIITSIYI